MGYSLTELEALLVAAEPNIGAETEYRLSDLALQEITAFGLAKADTVRALSNHARLIIPAAIDNYGKNLTIAQLATNIVTLLNIDANIATRIATDLIPLYASIAEDIGTEVLSNNETFATTWSRANGFTVSGGKLVYAHDASGGTATQLEADFNIADESTLLGKWFKLDYTVSESTYGTNAVACTVTTAFAAVAPSLDLTNGKHSIYFRSHATTITAFVLSATSSASGAFKIDNLYLNEIGATLDERDTYGKLLRAPKLAAAVEGMIRLMRQGEWATYAEGIPA